MGNFSRKAIIGGAAVITAAATAFMTTAAASAAPAARSAQAARALPATLAAPELPAALTWPLVVQGDRGERVVAIQYLLNQRIRAGLATDGIFGPLTASAVRDFQAICGIAVDGEVGNQTWPRLTVQVQLGSTGSAVRAVQHNLRYAYGFSSLAVDGIFGPVTQSAVRSFQARFKIGVDGIVGPVTWNTLALNEG